MNENIDATTKTKRFKKQANKKNFWRIWASIPVHPAC